MSDNTEREQETTGGKPGGKPVLPFVASGRALDLEYASEVRPPPLRGLEARCQHCGKPTYWKFDISLTAWNTLLALVTSVTDVSARDLGRADGRRPAARVHQARALLTQALLRVAGDDVAYRWLRLVYGWTAKRTKSFAELEVTNVDHVYLLENLSHTMQINPQNPTEATDGP